MPRLCRLSSARASSTSLRQSAKSRSCLDTKAISVQGPAAEPSRRSPLSAAAEPGPHHDPPPPGCAAAAARAPPGRGAAGAAPPETRHRARKRTAYNIYKANRDTNRTSRPRKQLTLPPFRPRLRPPLSWPRAAAAALALPGPRCPLASSAAAPPRAGGRWRAPPTAPPAAPAPLPTSRPRAWGRRHGWACHQTAGLKSGAFPRPAASLSAVTWRCEDSACCWICSRVRKSRWHAVQR